MQATPTIDSAVDKPTEAVSAEPKQISLLRNAKLGTFHIGSALADVLTAGVWNRVMITELGISATPISLLIAMKYFIAPLSIWAGQRSDVTRWRGYRRLPFIWGGRLMMALSFFLLGWSTIALIDMPTPEFAGNGVLAWLGITASFVIFSVGSAFSGTTFLALLYDIAPPVQRTRVVSVVWFFLITGFAFAGILLGRLLQTYTREGFITLFALVPLIMIGIWVFALFGEEKPNTSAADQQQSRLGAQQKAEQASAFWKTVRAAWANRQTRIFFAFLGMTTTLFYAQDIVLEPFGGSVFGMPTSTTSRFTSYWASMTLISIVVSLVLARRYPKTVNNTSLTNVSLYVLSIAFGMFFLSAAFMIRPLVTIALIVMGLGLGAWTVGTLGLMVDMTHAAGAGLYLSLWTLSETLARGVGTVAGGVIRDIGVAVVGPDPVAYLRTVEPTLSTQLVAPVLGQDAYAYAAVFLFQAVGFALSIVVLRALSTRRVKQTAPSTEMVLSAAMD